MPSTTADDNSGLDEPLQRKNEVLRAINEYSLALTSVASTDNLFKIIGDRLKAAVDAMGVAVASYDASSSDLIVRYTTLSAAESSAVARLLGSGLEGLHSKVSPEMHGRIMQEVVGDAGSLSESTFGSIPPATGEMIERLLGLGWFTGVALRHEQELLGTVVMAGRRGARRPDNEELEAFAGISANALRRWLVEHDFLAGEARYRMLTENLRDVIFELDTSLVFTYVSPSVEAFLGYEPDELTGRRFFDFITPASRDELAPRAARRLEQAAGERLAPAMYEFTMLHRDGRDIPVEVVSTPRYDAHARLLGFQGAARDVTERRRADDDRRRLENQLQQAMKMEAVGRLAGGIAHDFNNLLTAIMGNVSLALLDLDPSDPLVETMHAVTRAAETAAALTRRLLTFSRKRVIEARNLNLNELIAGMTAMLDRIIGEHIRLELRAAADLRPVRVDPGQIEQAILNLAVNARDAMPEGGTLTIETSQSSLARRRRLRYGALEAGEWVKLSVSDSGTGMDEEVLKHLFEPFFTTKPAGRGTGLGLAVLYGVVAQSGGLVDLRSEPGRGSTFDLYLPAAAGELPREAADAASTLPMGRETVLVVEDNQGVRGLVLSLLGRLGYRAFSAVDGDDTALMADELRGRIDLLITNMVLPGTSGRALAEKLAAANPGMKVLYISGYTEDELPGRPAAEGGAAFLAKPFLPAQLALKVREILDPPA